MKLSLILTLLFISCRPEAKIKDTRLLKKESLSKKIFHKKKYNYSEARRILMGKIHLLAGSKIEDIYCLKTYSNRDIKSKFKIGPNKIPDFKIINVEHIWPRSKFFSGKQGSKNQYETRKTDLHILYPSSTKLNKERSAHKFGEVSDTDKETETFKSVSYTHLTLPTTPYV